MSVIKNIKDLENFSINMNSFINDYNRIAGGCGCSNQYKMKGGNGNKKTNLKSFLNWTLPNLREGYKRYKLKGGENIIAAIDKNENDPNSFNLFRDVLSPNPLNNYTNQNSLSDYTYNKYSFEPEQKLSRSLF